MRRRISLYRLAKRTCLSGSVRLLDCGKYRDHGVEIGYIFQTISWRRRGVENEVPYRKLFDRFAEPGDEFGEEWIESSRKRN